jgi:CHAT domain-containing protein/tetratricopeptide (TPR) repeat protein
MSFSFRLSLCLIALNSSLVSPALARSQSLSCSLAKQHSTGEMMLTFRHFGFGLPQGDSRAQGNSSVPLEEAVLRAVVERYFSAYGRKDLAGVVALWSERSPDLATHRQRLQQQFTNEDLSFGSPVISRVKAESEKAGLRVTIALTSINLKSQQKSDQRLVLIFELVKESSEWKVWRYATAAEDLAVALVKADTEAEREGLLAEEKELVTIELGRALLTQGQQLISQDSYRRAIDIYKLALEIAGRSGDKGVTADALRSIGNVHWWQGNYTEAPEQYQKCLKIYGEIGDRAGIASTLNNIGNVHRMQGNYSEALEQYQKSLKISEERSDKVELARSLNSIGLVYLGQGNYSDALGQFQKSLKISEGRSDKAELARSLNSIGGVYLGQGNYSEALEQFQKSLRISEEIGNKAGIALLLNNIGLVHGSQGNYSKALEQYRKSLKIFEEMGNKYGIANTLHNIGLFHASQGNYIQALEQYQKSLKINEEMGYNAGIANSLNDIGNVHTLQGYYTEALEQCQKSLKIFEEIGDKAGIARSLNNIGYAHHLQSNYTQALQFAGRASDLAAQLGYREVIWEARTNAGNAYLALKQLGQARQSFDQAIATIEDLRAQVAGGERDRQRAFESKISPYYAMIELLIAQNNPGEALIYTERARARVLLDALLRGRVSVTKTMTSMEIEQERELKSRLVSLNTQINREQQRQQPDQNRLNQLEAQLQRARLDFEAFQTDLYIAHPELKPQRGEAPVIKPDEIAALLPDAKSALLEYAVTDDRTYMFVITNVQGKTAVNIRVYALPIKRAELAKQTEKFRQQLAGRDLGFHAAARQLYQLLLKPAQAQIQGKTNLIIVPDDKLWELPFQALVAEGGRYVIETSAVSYAPSLTALREMKAQHNKRRDDVASLALLALGNPAIGQETIERTTIALRDGKLDPLPSAQEEAKALGRLYGAARSKIYIGREAREDRVKIEARQARVLHFATHGILNDTAPMYSHLLLAQGDKNEDGLLEAWELMRLDLKADLAVLSACETARGRFGAGEGMIGLSWALFVAGVPATLVSQWKVESESTRDLMLNFHRQLKEPSTATRPTATRAEALRQAALKLMKDPSSSHPFYWAGFVLVGDNR